MTGAGSERGIGRAIALRLARAGAAVTVGDVDLDGARKTVATIEAEGAHALAVPLDVTDEQSVAQAVASVVERFGRVDILVNNAGISRSTPIWDITAAEWDRTLDVNLRGAFLCSKAVLPGMRERGYGRIVCIASVAGKQGGGIFGSVHYAASKAGLRGLCQGLARQCAPYGITSNAIAPSLVDTDIARRELGDETYRKLEERIRTTVPLGRLGRPEDIAAACHFLVSDAASYITGEILDVNGGSYYD